MERKIDRAVDHDGSSGITLPTPDASLKPLAKARSAAARVVPCEELFRQLITATGWPQNGAQPAQRRR